MKTIFFLIGLLWMAPVAQAQYFTGLREGFYKPDHLANGPLCQHRVKTIRDDLNRMTGLTITFDQSCDIPPEIYECQGKSCMLNRTKSKKAAEDTAVYYLYLYNENSYQRNVQTYDGTPGIAQNYDWFMDLNGQ